MSKSYGDTKALDNVSFKLSEGLSFILGPNGSGKTTFIKILSGITYPDAGEIKVLGKDYGDLTKGEISFSFEKTNLSPSIKVGEYLSAIGEWRGEDNSREVMEMFELRNVESKRFSELSQGYKRRFLVASAFVGSPKVVFLDEPFSNVDIVAKKRMMEVFMELKRERNIVIVSHVFTNIEEIDSLVVLYNGKVLRNLHGKELQDIGGFKAVFSDGSVVVNDLDELVERIRNGQRPVSIKPVTLEDWLMDFF
ncbi:ABC-type transport protein, ATPase component [Thermococcus gammatolerans EJ3]|uniref:ABC-type transport protein, ATPase component n=1 Tax=Thermococcus gammatolerans (strain DSM 15229 / JCM 11827 / EJ3) TaxID=593117 RepID=C5A4G8_THEGJ|nr:ABC-type transport protein, ATPase component [Thermococcus gammatolerans EJ3]